MVKKYSIYSTLIPLMLVVFSGSYPAKYSAPEHEKPLAIGAKMPLADYKMQDTDYNMLSLSMMRKKNGLLVLFTANTCGVADKWQNRYNMLAQNCQTYHIGMIAVDPDAALINGPESIRYNKQESDTYHYRFPYVSDSHDKVTSAFGVRQIPMVFLFNKNLKLVYRGAIDDSPANAGNAKNHYVMDAITSLGNGRQIPKAITRVNGCPVMWEND